MTEFSELAHATAQRVLPPASDGTLIEYRYLRDIDAYWFYQDTRGGLSIIVAGDGTFLLANSSVAPDDHAAAFTAGRRTNPTQFGDADFIHPDLVRMAARDEMARIQGYTTGDVNHHVNPIIGMLRLRRDSGVPLSDDDFAWAIEVLTKATYAELAWLDERGEL